MASLLTPLALAAPPQLLIGPGQVAGLSNWITARGFHRVLIVTSPSNGRRVDLLGLPTTCATEVFADLAGEPTLADVDRVRAAADRFAPDCVVGFGGGSAMDLAKLAAVLVGSDVALADTVDVNRTPARRCGLVQIPTTAGTGSEGGPRALVADPVGGKIAVASDAMLADLALIDADLMMSVPPRLTAATGIDALAHCAESFTSARAHPLIDLYALEGIRLVGRFLPRAVEDGKDREARAGLAVASLYGGYCLGPVNTTAGHAVAYPLGTRFHVPHGAAVAAIFPHTLAFNASAQPEKTALIAEALGLDEKNLRDSAHQLCAALGIEMRLSALGVKASDLASMADEAAAIRRLLDNNPRPIAAGDICAIYEAAL
jgi:alcohol dehydrogenase class IV